MVTTIFVLWPRSSVYLVYFLFVSPGTVVPSALVEVFPTFPLFSVGLTNIMWALSLAKNCSQSVLHVSEFGCYVE
jgi:hypothetical protein